MPLRVLKLMAGDELFPQVERGRAGHFYFPETAVPTWAECLAVLEEERDRQLRRASVLLDRVERELEAVRIDINEAREFPRQPLGIDLLSVGDWVSDRVRGQTTVSTILGEFVIQRWRITQYDEALRDAWAYSPDDGIGDYAT
jgi:hypothetical protein